MVQIGVSDARPRSHAIYLDLGQCGVAAGIEINSVTAGIVTEYDTIPISIKRGCRRAPASNPRLNSQILNLQIGCIRYLNNRAGSIHQETCASPSGPISSPSRKR